MRRDFRASVFRLHWATVLGACLQRRVTFMLLPQVFVFFSGILKYHKASSVQC